MKDDEFNVWAIGKARDLLRDLMGYDPNFAHDEDERRVIDALKEARRKDG